MQQPRKLHYSLCWRPLNLLVTVTAGFFPRANFVAKSEDTSIFDHIKMANPRQRKMNRSGNRVTRRTANKHKKKVVITVSAHTRSTPLAPQRLTFTFRAMPL